MGPLAPPDTPGRGERGASQRRGGRGDVSRCCATSIILRWDHEVDHQTDADPLAWLTRLTGTGTWEWSHTPFPDRRRQLSLSSEADRRTFYRPWSSAPRIACAPWARSCRSTGLRNRPCPCTRFRPGVRRSRHAPCSRSCRCSRGRPRLRSAPGRRSRWSFPSCLCSCRC